MLLPSSNQNSFLNLAHIFSPVTVFPSESTLCTLAQFQNWSMVNILSALRAHWFPANPLAFSVHANRSCQNFLRAEFLRVLSVYLLLISRSILDVISRCSNNLTVRSRIPLIMVGISLSNVSILGKFLVTIFPLYDARLESWMTIIYDSSTSSVAQTQEFYSWEESCH